MHNIRELLFTCNQKHGEYILSELQAVEKQLLKEPNSVQMIDARAAKLSDYSYPITKSSNWTAVIGYPRDYVANRHAKNQSRASILL